MTEAYCTARPDLAFCACDVREMKVIDGVCWSFLDCMDKRCPQLLRIRVKGRESGREIIPYFLIREGPDRQIMSYFLGKGLCNLAEVKEFFGSLFSRYCGSYDADELPHRKGSLSKIALWVHDCLTEDFDHQTSLNRQDLGHGVCISYDFGMAFSNHYYPPFYTKELGISDDSILENRLFLLDLLTRYARWLRTEEGAFVGKVESSSPTTSHADRCRYYLRNYTAHFPTRLYFGRFFEKVRNTPFEKEGVSEIAETIALDIRGLSDWESLIEALRGCPRGQVDLRGLDLSGMDLRGADLRRADLKGADLTGADLAGADLTGADMRGARVGKVDWRGTNLKDVKMDRT